MVFFGKEYWTQTLPAVALLESLFTKNKRGGNYKGNVLVTDDEQEAVAFLVRRAPPGEFPPPAPGKSWHAHLEATELAFGGLYRLPMIFQTSSKLLRMA
jgi:hypothetical protein